MFKACARRAVALGADEKTPALARLSRRLCHESRASASVLCLVGSLSIQSSVNKKLRRDPCWWRRWRQFDFAVKPFVCSDAMFIDRALACSFPEEFPAIFAVGTHRQGHQCRWQLRRCRLHIALGAAVGFFAYAFGIAPWCAVAAADGLGPRGTDAERQQQGQKFDQVFHKILSVFNWSTSFAGRKLSAARN